jgi:hypothetical protein
MEGDKDIFKAILEPFIVDLVSEALKKQRLEAINTIDDIDVEEFEDPVIQPLNRYCK